MLENKVNAWHSEKSSKGIGTPRMACHLVDRGYGHGMIYLKLRQAVHQVNQKRRRCWRNKMPIMASTPGAFRELIRSGR
jgi:hypothetical protein